VAVLGDSGVDKELSIRAMQMDTEDAIVLYYSGNYSEEQWNATAQTVNRITDEKLRMVFGNPIPCVRTINRLLRPSCSFIGDVEFEQRPKKREVMRHYGMHS
jgi:hypothetical protein